MTPSENAGSTESIGQNSGSVSAPVETSPQTERMIPQSQVDKIVHSRTRETAEKVRHEIESKYQTQNSMGGIPQMSESQIRQLVDETAEKKAREMSDNQIRQYHENQALQTAHEFTKKMQDAKSQFPDYDQVFEGVDFRNYADIVGTANAFGDKTARIMHELFSNPTKLSNMISLMSRDPMMASKAMKQMVDSFEQNAKAAEYKAPAHPLSRIQPSNAGVDRSNLNDMNPAQLRRDPLFKA